MKRPSWPDVTWSVGGPRGRLSDRVGKAGLFVLDDVRAPQGDGDLPWYPVEAPDLGEWCYVK
jgi:hypothetical protein